MPMTILEDADIGLGPEPSGGITLMVNHDSFPFPQYVPLSKERAEKLYKAFGEVLHGKSIAVATPADIARVKNG